MIYGKGEMGELGRENITEREKSRTETRGKMSYGKSSLCEGGGERTQCMYQLQATVQAPLISALWTETPPVYPRIYR